MKYLFGAIIAVIVISICGWFLWPKYCANNLTPVLTEDSKIRDNSVVFDEAAKVELKAYPENINGLVRKEFYLPTRESEQDYMVEIRVGREMEVDCNVHSYMGEITEEVVSGWGYPYWEANPTQVASTLMLCPEDEKTKEFIYLSKLIRYNSRLPVVVYAPSDAEVRYRVWAAADKEYNQN